MTSHPSIFSRSSSLWANNFGCGSEKILQLESVCEQQTDAVERLDQQVEALHKALTAQPSVQDDMAQLEADIAAGTEGRDRQLSQFLSWRQLVFNNKNNRNAWMISAISIRCTGRCQRPLGVGGFRR